jgi:hypothetical protein
MPSQEEILIRYVKRINKLTSQRSIRKKVIELASLYFRMEGWKGLDSRIIEMDQFLKDIGA